MTAGPEVPASDVICLGTSPGMMLEGLRCLRAGREVTFVDRAKVVGGGWAVETVFGLPDIETGVHFIENRRALNHALAPFLDPAIATVAPGTDFGLAGTRRIPMPLARALLYGGLAVKSSLQGDASGAVRTAGHAVAAARNLATPALYPARGVADMLARIREAVSAVGGEFRMGVEVGTVEPQTAAVLIEINGQAHRANTFVVSSRAHTPIRGGEDLLSHVRHGMVTGAVLRFDAPDLLFGGYVEILGHPRLKRIRNLTRDGTGLDGASLAVLQTKGHLDPVAVLSDLIGLGLLQDGTRICDMAPVSKPLTTLSTHAGRAIERRTSGQIRFINTIDLSDLPRSAG